jgi:hypothetical protein
MKLYAAPFYVKRTHFLEAAQHHSPVLIEIILAKSVCSRETNYAMCKVVKEIDAVCVQEL